jgi:hypothetical protein
MNNDEEDFVAVFVGDTQGPDDLVGFFEDTGESGDLYISSRSLKKIAHHLQIYRRSDSLEFSENDVRVIWSRDQRKCGVFIHGVLRGLINVSTGEGIRFLPRESSKSQQNWTAEFEWEDL